MFAKLLIATLIGVLVALQYQLWFGETSLQSHWRLREEVRSSERELLRLDARNRALAAEVSDLKSGLEAVEERARSDLGMIGADETFYRFVREDALDAGGTADERR